MPIYEYTCPQCGKVFEEWTQHHDAPESKPCPACGHDAHRIVSNTSFLLKGRGWYATEYGAMKGQTEGGPTSQPADAEAKAQGPAPDAAKSDAKPAAPASSGKAPAPSGKTTS